MEVDNGRRVNRGRLCFFGKGKARTWRKESEIKERNVILSTSRLGMRVKVGGWLCASREANQALGIRVRAESLHRVIFL